jgi:hypothetical protein
VKINGGVGSEPAKKTNARYRPLPS